jgi:septal ring factor EnvC (AmiA/AmiB activator)
MKTIKKYWALIVAGIAALFGLFVIVSKKQNEKKSDKLKQKIDDNTQQIDQLQGKIEVIEEQRTEVKEEIKQQEEIIEALEEQKENITIAEPTDVKSAKANIIKKTNRGRKAKNK